MAVTQTGSREAAGCPGHTQLKHKHSLLVASWHTQGVRVCVHSCFHRAATTGQCQTLRGWDQIVSEQNDSLKFHYFPEKKKLCWFKVCCRSDASSKWNPPFEKDWFWKARPLQSQPTDGRAQLLIAAPEWKNSRPYSVLWLLTCFTRRPVTGFIIQARFPPSVCLRREI